MYIKDSLKGRKPMTHHWELGGQRIYLNNQGNQTIVTIATLTPGQQQQSTSSFTTGNWLSAPEMVEIPGGAVFKIQSNQGETIIQIQGSNVSVSSGTNQSSSSTSQTSMKPMQPMQPMQPMPPMTMGGMTMNPMEMRMGNMELKMGENTVNQSTQNSVTRFCTQCGERVKESDRFCASCGYRLER
jgi:hypothetical protein